jgi:hypothetical protein
MKKIFIIPMKKTISSNVIYIFFSIVLLFIILSFTNENETYVKFKTEVKIRKNIRYGEKCIFEFPFKNIGDKPLFIEKVKTTSGCVVAYFNRDTIQPKMSSKIVIRYDSQRIGVIDKSAIVYFNIEKQAPILLRIKGNILPKKEGEK